MSKYFTTKDLDKIKKKLNKTAKPLKGDDLIALPFEVVKTLVRMDRWATKVLNQAVSQNN